MQTYTMLWSIYILHIFPAHFQRFIKDLDLKTLSYKIYENGPKLYVWYKFSQNVVGSLDTKTKSLQKTVFLKICFIKYKKSTHLWEISKYNTS